LAFASRLMEQEGIWYYFEHTKDEHVLVLRDSVEGLQAVPDRAEIRFDDGTGGVRDSLRVLSWEKGQTIHSRQHKVRDYNFQVPRSLLEGSAGLPQTANVGAVAHTLAPGLADKLEHYQPYAGYAHRYEGIGPAGESVPDHLKPVFDAGGRNAHLH